MACHLIATPPSSVLVITWVLLLSATLASFVFSMRVMSERRATASSFMKGRAAECSRGCKIAAGQNEPSV